MELLASASMRLYRIYTRSSGESAIEIREVPMSGPRPTSPAFQAGALFFRETPANKKACSYMNKLEKNSCSKFHLNAPAAYFNSIKFWKTPVKQCGNGKSNCMDYTKWQQAWTDIKS